MTIKILADIIEAKRISSVGEPTAIAAVNPRFQLATTFDIAVPADYNHATRLDTFKRKYGKKFCYYNNDITDSNFSRATTQLAPGQQLKVKVFQITETVTSEDCLAFLRSQNAILVGAQGATLTYEQGKNQLSKGRWHASFDEKDALWQDAYGYHRVPIVRALSLSDLVFEFGLGNFERDWFVGSCLLCFCDSSAEALAQVD